MYVRYNLNSLLQIAALENITVVNVTKEEGEEKEVEEKEEGLSTDSHGGNATKTIPTDPKPTDSPLKNKKVRLESTAYIQIRVHSCTHSI